MNYDLWAENLAKHVHSKQVKIEHVPAQQKTMKLIDADHRWYDYDTDIPDLDRWVLMKFDIMGTTSTCFSVATRKTPGSPEMTTWNGTPLKKAVCWRYIELPDM
jgi:hypothetical protein